MRNGKRIPTGLVVSVPAILTVLSVSTFPLLFSFVMSFYDMNVVARRTSFVGLDNYLTIFSDPEFLHSFGLTAYYAAFTLGAALILGLGYALLLNERFFGRRIVMTLTIVPWSIPMVVTGAMWRWILHPEYGALDGLLNQLGLISGHINYFPVGLGSLTTVATVQVWRDTPLACILFLAALQAVPKELYYASEVDGANTFQRFKSITLPWLRPAFLVVVMLLTVNAFIQYDLIYMLTQGGPGFDTTIMSWQIYTVSFRKLQYTLGMAFAWILAAITFVLSYIYVRSLYGKLE